MTKKMYLDNPYLREYKARIIKKDKINNELHITLDKTIFCPNVAIDNFRDKGTLDGIDIIDIYESRDNIVHVLNGNIKGKEVNMVLDWDERFDHMQQHTGQHLLSASINRLYNKNTLNFHFGKESSYIDIEMPNLNSNDVNALEKFSNSIVYSNFKINSYNNSGTRMVDIDGIDISHCSGVHCSNTGEVGIIKIIDYKKIEDSYTRIEYICGSRVLKKIDELLKEIESLKQKL